MGFTASYTGTALVSMKEERNFGLGNSEISWVVSIMSVGGCLGSAIGGPLIDYFGRKSTILGSAFPFIAAYLLIGFANEIFMIIMGRFLAGICVGINSTAIPVFLGETLESRIRGTLGIFPTAMGNGGILIALVAGKYLDWRELAYLGAVLPLPYLLIMLATTESPRFYVSKNRLEDAQTALQWYRGPDVDITDEFNEMVAITRSEEMQPKHGVIAEFRKPSNYHPFFIILVLMTIQQFSGINAIIAFIVPIFQATPIPLDSNTCAILFGVINFLAVFMAVPLIDKKGRKVLLYISDLFMSEDEWTKD